MEEENDDDDDDEIKRPSWYEQYQELYEEIEKKKEEFDKIDPKTFKQIEEINNIFNEKISNNKPKDFIEYILTNYPYFNYNSSLKADLLKQDLKDLIKEISPCYHPDTSRNCLYNYVQFPLKILHILRCLHPVQRPQLVRPRPLPGDKAG